LVIMVALKLQHNTLVREVLTPPYKKKTSPILLMPNWQSRLSIDLTSWQNTITFNSVVLMSMRLKIVAWQSDTSVMLKSAPKLRKH
jgi:hypothetical protein